MRRFDGANVLVTGGSSGIGLATARAFLEEGARVAITGRDEKRLRTARAGLSPLGKIVAVRGDVSKPVDARRFVAQTTRSLGPLDVLVNNAGIYINRPIVQLKESEYDRVLDINLKGAWLSTKYVLPGMIERGRGAIVNVASDSGLVGTAGSSAYCASKGGMVLMTMAVALEVASHGIRVNAVCPGEVDTPMLWAEAEASGKGDAYYEELFAPIPMKRAATPEEVAAAILFLASNEASFMTGAAMSVDGGATAR